MRISDWSSDVCSSDLDHLTGGRIALHVITGKTDAEQEGDGDFTPKAERYRRAQEYLHLVKRTWRSEERSVGEEWVRKWRSRWSQDNSKKKEETKTRTVTSKKINTTLHRANSNN